MKIAVKYPCGVMYWDVTPREYALCKHSPDARFEPDVWGEIRLTIDGPTIGGTMATLKEQAVIYEARHLLDWYDRHPESFCGRPIRLSDAVHDLGKRTWSVEDGFVSSSDGMTLACCPVCPSPDDSTALGSNARQLLCDALNAQEQ